MLKLFLVVLGAKPSGRNIEQHDIAFVVGERIEDTFDDLKKHWDTKVHIDSYMQVQQVDGYQIELAPKDPSQPDPDPETHMQLYFINLGGYKASDLEEHHKKLVIASHSLDEAKKIAKQDSFCKTGLMGPDSRPHVDDKSSIRLDSPDVDDVLVVNKELPQNLSIKLTQDPSARFENNKITAKYWPI
jgi:hypothetical protein